MRRRNPLRDMSVATRLSIVALMVTLISLGITAAVGLSRGNDLADGLAEGRLTTVGASRETAIESYLAGVRSEIASLALSPGASNAIERFADGYRDLASQPPSADETNALTEYYLEHVVPPLEDVRGGPVRVTSLLPTGPGAIALQLLYTVPEEPDDGDVPIDPVLVTDPGDGSAYSEVHSSLHPVFQGIGALSMFDDVYLIDASSDVIVYSVRKSTDFATSLDAGPLSGSSLSTLIETLADDPEAGSSEVIDFAAYPPAQDRPRMFVASPVHDAEGSLVGYLAASLSTGPIDDIISGEGKWQGFGETGEVYLVGSDGIMRSTTRSFAESPVQFLAPPDEPGPNDLTEDQRRRIAETGTTALVQPVARDVLTLAEGGSGTTRTQNYQGVDVLTSYGSPSIDGLDWMLFADVEANEIDEPIEDYARNMLFAMALFVVAVTFVAVKWSDGLLAPIRTIATRLRSVRTDADGDEESGALPDGSPSEYLELSSNIEQMLERLTERRTEVAARSAERARLVANFLPAAAAKRTSDGDDVLDHARNATATVLVIGGVGGLVEGMTEGETRDILADIVDQLDELTTEFGLQRVKIAGTAYFAVCGVSPALLDHAPRSVGFALAAAELVADVADERDTRLALAAGVDAGAISVGLTARSGLVYDAWGAAVTSASELARHAPEGTVAVSAVVREQLPRDYVLAADGTDGATSVVTGRVDTVAT